MWNDPGSPWHAQTGAPLLCAYRFLYGAERDRQRMDIMWEEEKCFAGQLSKKVSDSLFPPFRANTASRARLLSSSQLTVWLWQGETRSELDNGWSAGVIVSSVCVCVGREGCALLESYIQLKTRSRLFSRDAYIRKTRAGGRPLLYTACASFTLTISHLTKWCEC